MTKEDLLDKIANKIIFNVRQQLERNNSISTKNLSNNITKNISGNKLSISMLDYAIYLDEGTRGTETGLPSRKLPPINEIKKWVSNKGININPWAIAKNIQKFGTKPHPFLFILDDLDFSILITDYINDKIEEIEFKDKKIVISI